MQTTRLDLIKQIETTFQDAECPVGEEWICSPYGWDEAWIFNGKWYEHWSLIEIECLSSFFSGGWMSFSKKGWKFILPAVLIHGLKSERKSQSIWTDFLSLMSVLTRKNPGDSEQGQMLASLLSLLTHEQRCLVTAVLYWRWEEETDFQEKTSLGYILWDFWVSFSGYNPFNE